MRPLPCPSGWFVLASSRELAPGQVLTRRLGDSERVLFRGPDGAVSVLAAHCPHLGAHLGHGGKVSGGQLVCPFHGRRFDGGGRCDWGTTNRQVRTVVFPAKEIGGWILSWFDPAGGAPSWSPPPIEEEGWCPLRSTMVPLRTHPQETTENSVDLAHFPIVHGYRDVELQSLEMSGPHLRTRYRFVRPGGLPWLGRNLEVHIDVHVWGLGFSRVEVDLPSLGMTTRQFVLPTPVGDNRVELRLGMAIRRGDGSPAFVRAMPRWLFEGPVGAQAMRQYVRDVLGDREIWENKVHQRRPVFGQTDGPIARYRAWCRQFYPDPLLSTG